MVTLTIFKPTKIIFPPKCCIQLLFWGHIYISCFPLIILYIHSLSLDIDVFLKTIAVYMSADVHDLLQNLHLQTLTENSYTGVFFIFFIWVLFSFFVFFCFTEHNLCKQLNHYITAISHLCSAISYDFVIGNSLVGKKDIMPKATKHLFLRLFQSATETSVETSRTNSSFITDCCYNSVGSVTLNCKMSVLYL